MGDNTKRAAPTTCAPPKRYYSVNDLDVDGFDVIVVTPGGQEIIARRRVIARLGRPEKVIWQARIEKREPGMLATTRSYADLPRRLEITRWRPLHRASFPGSLPARPARIESDVAWQTPVEASAPAEDADDLHWAKPYSEPPKISPREAEVRTLRALRTMRSP